MVIRYDDCGATVVLIRRRPNNDGPWISATAYNYGIGDAHYPVPAIPLFVSLHVGAIIQGEDCHLYGVIE